MAYFYTYLISGLPSLRFGLKAPFSFEKFISSCSEFIPETDIGILKKASILGDYTGQSAHPALKKWEDFDTMLRNELVKVRASRKHLDQEKYLRREEFAGPDITHLAMSAHRNPAILEAEKLLDEERWRILDEFSFGHYFDLDFLIIYALKLLILERWEKINTQDKEGILEETLKFN